MHSLEQMFAPHSIAIIGASRRVGTLGRMFFDAIRQMNFQGKIFPVNPKSSEIDGVKCYPEISELPETPDLAVLLIPKQFILSSLEALAEKRVKNVIVISAGFRETGPEGAKLENALIDTIKRFGMRMIGPNSMGLFNTHPDISLNATFSPTPPAPGHVAFISQSGALGVAVLELSQKMNIGFSVFVSTGNKADIGDVDVLSFAAEDPNTKVITLYQESIDHTREFRRICMQTIQNKPILVLKAGRTTSGLRAASSHTGALSSDDHLTDAFLKQSGVIRCQSLSEMLYTAQAMNLQPVPQGNRVAVVTNAGGPGILASDALEQYGLDLAKLSDQTVSELRRILPAEAGLLNPVDMIASATHDTYRTVCEILEADQNVDLLLVIIVKPPVDTTPQLIIENLGSVLDHTQKPVFCVLMAHVDANVGIERFKHYSLPVYHYPDQAAQVISNMYRYQQLCEQKDLQPPKVLPSRKHDRKHQAPFELIMERLSKYRLSFAPYIIATHLNEAVEFYQNHSNVALKVINEEIIHKSDSGLVQLNLKDKNQLSVCFNDLQKKACSLIKAGTDVKILVQQMVPSGLELILGATYDRFYGPVIMFGLGGIFVEIFRDVSFRILPIQYSDTTAMINELQVQEIFRGYRDKPPVDLTILEQVIFDFANLVEQYEDILEMDLNPIIYDYNIKKVIVVDARMTLNR